MNAVTFNDKIKDMIAGWPARDAASKLFPNWETSPLFMYDEPETEAEAASIVKNFQDDVFEAFPFPVFRFDVTVGDKSKPRDYGKYKAKALVCSYPDGPTILARVESLMHTEATYSIYRQTRDISLPLYMLVNGIRQEKPGATDFYCNSNVLCALKGKWLPAERTPEFFRTYINGFLKSLAAFNLSAMTPTNHIVEVRPDAPGRSVEWVKARTHYTLITHGHPANRREVKSGEQVKTDTEGELTRMAHNRRKHKRTYRHARYRFARGQTRWVRATWVGPREWKDEGGKQIYKILEPVDEDENAEAA